MAGHVQRRVTSVLGRVVRDPEKQNTRTTILKEGKGGGIPGRIGRGHPSMVGTGVAKTI